MAVSITLMEAYLIETPLSKGMSIESLLDAIQHENITAIIAMDDSLEYGELIEAAKKDPERIQAAIQSGYSIKYVSKYGIERLLKLKFDLESGKDYEIDDNKFSHVPLEENAVSVLETMLSSNWRIVNRAESGLNVRFDIRHVAEL